MKFALKIGFCFFFCKVIVGYKIKIKGVIGDLKLKNVFFNLKLIIIKYISRTFCGTVVDSVGSIHFQIVPWSSLYFSRSIGPFLCSWWLTAGF